MKLPNITYGGVQSLGRVSPQTEAAAAELPYQAAQSLVGDAYESYDHYELLQDQENALSEVNKSGAVNDVVKRLKDNEINLSNLPASVVDNYRKSFEYDQTSHGYADGAEFAPSHKVAQSVYNWANDELKGGNERLRSKRAQALYTDAIGADTEAAFKEAGVGIRQSQVNALIVNNNVAINRANTNGNIDTALALTKNGLASGLYSPEKYNSMRKEVFRFNKEILNGNQKTSQVDIYNAAFSGSDKAVAAVELNQNNQIANARRFGSELINDAERNEYTRAFNTEAYRGDVDREAQTISISKGVEASLTWIEAQERQLDKGDFSNVPEGLTVADVKGALSQSRARVRERSNAIKTVSEAFGEKNKAVTDLLDIAQEVKDNGFIPNNGKSYNQYSGVFANQMAVLKANGATPEQINQEAVKMMAHYKQIPEGIRNTFDAVGLLDTDEQLKNVELYTYLRAVKPEIAQLYTGKSASFLNSAADEALAAGYGGTEASIEKLTNRYFNEESKKDYELNINEAKTNGTLAPKALIETTESITDLAFDDSWFWQSSPEMQARTKRMARDMFTSEIGGGADKEAAIKTVAARLAENIGVTKTNPYHPDGVSMFMPPEKVYGEWAIAQFEEVKNKQFGAPVEGGEAEYNPAGIFLQADGLTMHQGEPSYKIMYLDPNDPDGVPFQLTSNDLGGKYGVITGASGARWRPNGSDTPQAKEAAEQKFKAVTSLTAIKENQAVIYDMYKGALANSDMNKNSSPNEIQMALSDANKIIKDTYMKEVQNKIIYKTVRGQEVVDIRATQKMQAKAEDAYDKAIASAEKEALSDVGLEKKRRMGGSQQNQPKYGKKSEDKAPTPRTYKTRKGGGKSVQPTKAEQAALDKKRNLAESKAKSKSKSKALRDKYKSKSKVGI